MPLPLDALHYDLPPELIAQQPVEPRDASRLLVCDRATGAAAHHTFRDLPALLPPGALLVVNETRVRPARLVAEKPTGGAVEVLVLRDLGAGRYRVLCSRRRRLHVGNRLVFFDGLLGATLVAMDAAGEDEIQADDPRLFAGLMDAWGIMPLPPYITEPLADPERYQTIFAAREASAAAPTAGLHFTPRLVEELQRTGHQFARVELEVGLGTFEPVRSATLEGHRIHSERGVVPEAAAMAISEAKRDGRAVVAVGTTTTRLLEHAAKQPGGFGTF
ncbi:MAG TPA: S-adenosylmethionine:tRNA ribosyltransferase-isomerase, partial [bacterium]|nr:S-adenosylmethionine:tRNA ribosyltransferase-isomerase [bacterium]